MRTFYIFMMHIREGVKRKYKHCHIDKRKIILNKKTVTTTTSIVDAKPLTNAAKLLSNANIKNTTTKTTKTVEEDKTILSVDMNKFFNEFLELIKTLDGKFYKCKLQKMNDSFYYLNCFYEEPKLNHNRSFSYSNAHNVNKKNRTYSSSSSETSRQSDPFCTQSSHSFKILIHIAKDTNKVDPKQNKKKSGKDQKTPSPSSSHKPSEALLSSPINSNSETALSKLGHQQGVSTRKYSVSQYQPGDAQTVNSSSPNSQILKQSNKPFAKSYQTPQIKPPADVKQEITTNQIKMKIYFEFNHTTFEHKENLIKMLISQFNDKLDDIIKLVYLTLTLKEIHDTRKWNNSLTLKENILGDNETLNQSGFSQNTADDLDEIHSPSLSHDNNNENNDSVLTIKNQNPKTSLVCNCVWSVLFKLHRLHQTTQRVHGTIDLTPSAMLQQQQQQQAQLQQSQQQAFISQGFKKLQESLVNFRIDESNCGDLYVYTRKNEIYLLKLEEVYENQAAQTNQPNVSVVSQNQNLTSFNDNSVEMSGSYAKAQQQQNQQSKLNMLSRRPSYASIADSDSAGKLILYNFKKNLNSSFFIST